MPDPTVNQILASLDDIQTHLPVDKLDVSASVAESAINLLEIDVDRLIKGMLSGVFTPLTLAGWDEPDHTPDQIRRIAGMLIAAIFYAQRFSEDNATVGTGFAQNLYNCGLSALNEIITGQIILPSPTPTPGTVFNESFFLPNSSSTPPKFSMDTVFG